MPAKRISELLAGAITDAQYLAFDAISPGTTVRATVAAFRNALGVVRSGATVVVGNTAAGDVNLSTFNICGFRYYSDPGDGTGIEAALAAVSAGVIHVRRGTYNLQAGAVAGPLTIPAGVTLRGEGVGTVIVGRSTGNQQAVAVEDGGVLESLRISVPTGVGGATGDFAVGTVGRARLSHVEIEIAPGATSALRRGVDVAGGRLTVHDVKISSSTFIEYDYDSVGPILGSEVQLLSLGSNGANSRVDGEGLELVGGDIHIISGNAFLITDWCEIQIANLVSTGWRRAFYCQLQVTGPFAIDIQNFAITDAGASVYTTGLYGSAAFLLCEGLLPPNDSRRPNVRIQNGTIDAGASSEASLIVSIAPTFAPNVVFENVDCVGFKTIAMAPIANLLAIDFDRCTVIGAEWRTVGSIAPISTCEFRLRDSYIQTVDVLGVLEDIDRSHIIITGITTGATTDAISCLETRYSHIEATYLTGAANRVVHRGSLVHSLLDVYGNEGALAVVCVGSAIKSTLQRLTSTVPTVPMIETFGSANRIESNRFSPKTGAAANVPAVGVLVGHDGVFVIANRFEKSSHVDGIDDAATGTVIANNYLTTA
jgi:hypothetical protein